MEGVPAVPSELDYGSPYHEGMSYRFAICGNVTMNGSYATVYLTNDTANAVYIKLRVFDGDGNILGETGLLKPGEYVKDIELRVELTEGTKICLKIMGYEPNTYYSAGATVLHTQVGE